MGSYEESSWADLRALTRLRRAEARARRSSETIRFSFGETVEFDGQTASIGWSSVSRNKGLAARWRKRQWKAGVRHCAYCNVPMVNTGFPKALQATVDHRISLAMGGLDSEANWVMCCWSCNNMKGMMSEDEFRRLLKPDDALDRTTDQA